MSVQFVTCPLLNPLGAAVDFMVFEDGAAFLLAHWDCAPEAVVAVPSAIWAEIQREVSA
jgi:hypothetical protein